MKEVFACLALLHIRVSIFRLSSGFVSNEWSSEIGPSDLTKVRGTDTWQYHARLPVCGPGIYDRECFVMFCI